AHGTLRTGERAKLVCWGRDASRDAAASAVRAVVRVASRRASRFAGLTRPHFLQHDPAGAQAHCLSQSGLFVDRKAFLSILSAVVLATPLAAEAQPTAKVWRVGVLMDLYPPNANPPQALRQRLRDL